MVRHVTMADWDVLGPGQYLLHNWDGKYCPAFQRTIDAAGVTCVPVPSPSPYVNAYAERCARSRKGEVLSQRILFGERSLRHALTEYVTHDHQERPRQCRDNVVLMPALARAQVTTSGNPIRCRERLGGLLKYYERAAA
jgi:putative transposase